MRSQSSHAQQATSIPPRLHEVEGKVMDEVWRRREASVREVMEAVNAGAPRQRAHTTYIDGHSPSRGEGHARAHPGGQDRLLPAALHS